MKRNQINYIKYFSRKNGKKIVSFYNEEIKRKRDVPFYFKERLKMKEKMNTDENRNIFIMGICSLDYEDFFHMPY